MDGSKLLVLAFAACAAAVAWPLPADGQCRLCETPTTTQAEVDPGTELTLEIETSLNFDRLILTGSGPATVLIRPDGSSHANGSVTGVGPRAAVGSVLVRGEPGRSSRVEIPRRIVLRSFTGSEIAFEEVVTDLPSLPRLDSAGRLTFRFGGRLEIDGDIEGQFDGDLPITVEYL